MKMKEFGLFGLILLVAAIFSGTAMGADVVDIGGQLQDAVDTSDVNIVGGIGYPGEKGTLIGNLEKPDVVNIGGESFLPESTTEPVVEYVADETEPVVNVTQTPTVVNETEELAIETVEPTPEPMPVAPAINETEEPTAEPVINETEITLAVNETEDVEVTEPEPDIEVNETEVVSETEIEEIVPNIEINEAEEIVIANETEDNVVEVEVINETTTVNETAVNDTEATSTVYSGGGPARMTKQELIQRIDSREIDDVNSTMWSWYCDRTVGVYDEYNYGHQWKIMIFLNDNATVTDVAEVKFGWVYENDGEFEYGELGKMRYFVADRAIKGLAFLPELEPVEPVVVNETTPTPTTAPTQAITPTVEPTQTATEKPIQTPIPTLAERLTSTLATIPQWVQIVIFAIIIAIICIVVWPNNKNEKK